MRQFSLLNIVFPPNSAPQIASCQLMSKITFESNGNREKEEKTKRMFEQYVEEIAMPKKVISRYPFAASRAIKYNRQVQFVRNLLHF